MSELPAAGERPVSTLEEWLELGEDVAGEFVVDHVEDEEAADFVHELAVTWLAVLLRGWLGAQGFVAGSEVKMVVAANRGRKADLLVLLPGSAPPPRRGPLVNPPDIVVEVVTPSPRDERRDRVEKMAEYAAFGVRYYWIVDPALGSFEIFERSAPGNYTKVVGVTAGRVDPVPGCKGLVFDVDALWAELARVPE
ncbi:MAG: Uma2 family endonuclease [Labilithrix sp.]|nr:Uma2 family endonuclease [Labilithrix sp.]MCW5812559.1 Uma2 family endonuclease [Labilithrix sp.]